MCSKQIISTDDSRSDRQDVFPIINEIIARLSEKELRTALMAMAHQESKLFIFSLSDSQALHDGLLLKVSAVFAVEKPAPG